MTFNSLSAINQRTGFALVEVLISSVLFIVCMLTLLAFHQSLVQQWKHTMTLTMQHQQTALLKHQSEPADNNIPLARDDIARLNPVCMLENGKNKLSPCTFDN